MKNIKRTLIVNKNGQYTITLPKLFMQNMGAEPGDQFKFIYRPDDILVLRRVVRDAS